MLWEAAPSEGQVDTWGAGEAGKYCQEDTTMGRANGKRPIQGGRVSEGLGEHVGDPLDLFLTSPCSSLPSVHPWHAARGFF